MSRRLPNWVDSWVEYCDQLQMPALYKPWVALSTIASCVGRGIHLPWHTEVYGNFVCYPNLFIMLLSDSGVGKSTAMGPSQGILEEIGDVAIGPDSCTWQGLINEWSMQTETVKGKSMTVMADELATFLQQESKLSKMHSQLAKVFDCPKQFKYVLVSREFQLVTLPCLNIIGGTTRPGLRRMVPPESSGEGLLGRFIPLFGDRIEKKIVRAEISEMADPDIYPKLQEDLKTINNLVGAFSWTQEFYDAYGQWHLEDNPEEALSWSDPFNSLLMGSYRRRRATYIHKLSMLFSIAEQDTLRLDIRHFNRALELLETTEQGFGEIFRTYGSDYSNAMTDSLFFIEKNSPVLRSEIYARALTISRGWEIKDQLESFKEAGFIRTGPAKGAPYDRLIYWIPEEERKLIDGGASANNSTDLRGQQQEGNTG